LDRAFEDSFEECALKAIDYTDGTASITRANLVYAFENLSYFSKINISGLGGSELIKPVYKANMQVSRETFELLCADNFDKKFKNAFKKVKALNYLKPDVIESFTEEIKEDFKRNYIKGLSGHDRLIKFYVFLIQESWRKYLMQEMRMVRPYVETRTPYFDEDFVELIFRTPFAGIYNGATKKNPFLRRNGLSFYGKLIHKLSPELGRFITDRGYRPSDIILPFWLKAVKVTPHYVKNKLNRIIRGDDTFRPWPWSRNMLRKYIYSIGREDELFTDSLIRDFENKPNLEKNFRFYSIFSFRLWSSLFLKN
jgi:hypothetical protein